MAEYFLKGLPDRRGARSPAPSLDTVGPLAATHFLTSAGNGWVPTSWFYDNLR